jgi:transcriptional regulator with XRE-family HTH domain
MDNAESVGKYLKKEREARNLSLSDVAKKTRITEQILDAIEEDRHDLLPPATYVRGFLTAYARSLGIDPNDVVLRYQGHYEEKPGLPPKAPPEKKVSSKGTHRWVIPFILVCILVGLVLFYILYIMLPQSTAPVQLPPPKPLAKPEPVEPAPVPTPEIAPPILPKQDVPFSLQFKAVEETWIRIQIKGQPDKEVILKPGETLSQQVLDRILLRVGNAGGLDLIFNGKTLNRFGKSGEVVNLVFTAQGLEANPPEKPKLPSE